jgi:hypothetical protein
MVQDGVVRRIARQQPPYKEWRKSNINWTTKDLDFILSDRLSSEKTSFRTVRAVAKALSCQGQRPGSGFSVDH